MVSRSWYVTGIRSLLISGVQQRADGSRSVTWWGQRAGRKPLQANSFTKERSELMKGFDIK